MPAGMALLLRYMPGCLLPGGVPQPGQYNWMYNMITTQRPLEEKMSLFWHHVFATGNSKVDNCDQMLEQLVMFRKYGMGNYRDMLVALSQNPAMIFWLDNNENHRDAVNENWGRELLELFSMGVSNYTEVDVREASRAFTGWTIQPKLPRQPFGRFPWRFEYLERGRGPRRWRKDLPGPHGRLERGGHHRHHRQGAGHLPVHLPPPLQLLRRRRGAGAGLDH